MNGQSTDTALAILIGYTRHRTKTNKPKTQPGVNHKPNPNPNTLII
jgi:hypothetical protein